jgi:parvulin-like peptidyl-prolyl isomerase
MQMVRTLWILLLLPVVSSVLPAGEGPSTPEERAALKKERDLEDIIEGVPVGPLEDGVVLQSGDIKILAKTIEKVENAYMASERRKVNKFQATMELTTYLRKRFAFRFLANALVEKYVADNKVEFIQDKFDEHYKKFQQAKADEAGSYEQWLLDNGIDDAEFRRFWSANWAIEQSMGAQVSNDEVNAMYEKMRDEIPFRRASHLLFMYKGSQRAEASIKRSKEEALAAAENAILRIRGGEDFAKIAEESDCPSKKSGGDVSYFARKGAMAEQFADATYTLAKVGDVTVKPVETAFGYHVIKLTDIRNEADVKKELRQHLTSRRFSNLLQEMMENAGKQAKFNEKYIVDLDKANKPIQSQDPLEQARKLLDQPPPAQK